MEEINPSALEYAQNRLLLTAVRALMESHPNAASFRESWAHCWALTYRDHTRDTLGKPYHADTEEAIRLLMPVWQSYFPDSEAANSKPQGPGTPSGG
jgi:hypothetical protein